MEKVHVAVAWYQKKIGSYDKQIWEQSVEQKVLKILYDQTVVRHQWPPLPGLKSATLFFTVEYVGESSSIQLAPRRSVRQKTELIDVDLVRGSTFSRAKPQVSWTYITHKAITRVIFFPLFYKWWLQQMSLRFWLMMLTLYVMQVISCIIFFRNVGENAIQDEYSMSSVVIPILLMIILSQIHSQTVLSHFSHKSHHRDGKLGRDGKNRRRFSSSDFKRSVSLPNGALSENIGHKTTSESKINTRKNLKSSLNEPDLNKFHVTSVQKTTQNQVIAEEAVCNGSSDPGNMSRINLGGTEPKSVSWSDAYCMASRHLSGHETPDSEVPSDEEESHEDKEVSEKDLKSEDETDDKDFLISSTNNTLPKEEFQNNCEEDILHGAKVNPSSEILTHPSEIEGTCISPKDGKIVLNQKLEISLEIRNNSLDDVFVEDKSKETTINSEVMQTNNGCDHGDRLLVDAHVDSGLGRNSIDDTESGAKSSSSAESLCNSSLGASSSACSYSNKRIIKNLRKEPVTSCLKNRNRSETGSDSENDVIGKKSSYKGLRRRKPTPEDGSEAVSGSYRNRRPCSLGVKGKSREGKGSPGVSSSEGELSNTPDGSKATMSSEAEWEDRVQSDVTTSTYSSSCSDNEISDNDDTRDTMDESMNSLFPSAANTVPSNNVDRVSMTTISTSNTHVINLLQPGQVHAASSRGRSYSLGTSSTGRSTFGGHEFRKGISGRIHGSHEYPTSNTTVGPPPDKVSCMIWEDKECKKVDLTALDIGWSIIEKVDNIPESSDYIWIGAGFSLVIGLVPLVFCAYQIKDIPDLTSTAGINKILQMILANSWRINLIVINGIIQRLCLSGIFFFLLSVADRTFKQRLLYAKHFCYLTSSRRAKKFDMPHFRLNKVRNIKTWLSLRSYLKKRGPQRSVDVIVSATCLLTIVILTLMCIQLLKDTDTYLDFLCNWELLVWCMALGVYLLRFMTLGLKINKKYRNLSVLITEQINLYLQMEQKPHKKEELMVANNVLKLAEDLLKELESPFKISGVSANPVIYNVTKVVVLSAFSAVLTELLGFKLKLYKIKLKA